jgi:hypothetical protein
MVTVDPDLPDVGVKLVISGWLIASKHSVVEVSDPVAYSVMPE